MRLLISADAMGGVWTWALDLARGLRLHGIAPVVAVLGPPPSPAQRAAAADIALVETGLALDWLAADEAELRAAAQGLARLAGDVAADALLLHAAALAAWPLALPTVVVAHSCPATWWAALRHGPLPPDLAWRARLAGRGYRLASRIVAPSAAFAAATATTYALPAPPIVVRNGRRPALQPAAGPADVALAAGRLWDDAKNAATLDAAARLTLVPVHAAGPITGPAGHRFEARSLTLLGALEEAAMAAHLAERPIFLSMARYEPFGLAVLEAAQAGCALLLSDIPAHRELWDGAATFVPPLDAAGVAAAIDRLAADPAARAAAGAAASARAGHYGIEPMAAGMAAVLRAAAPQARQAA